MYKYNTIKQHKTIVIKTCDYIIMSACSGEPVFKTPCHHCMYQLQLYHAISPFVSWWTRNPPIKSEQKKTSLLTYIRLHSHTLIDLFPIKWRTNHEPTSATRVFKHCHAAPAASQGRGVPICPTSPVTATGLYARNCDEQLCVAEPDAHCCGRGFSGHVRYWLEVATGKLTKLRKTPPCSRGKSSINGSFSIAMLVYWRVPTIYKGYAQYGYDTVPPAARQYWYHGVLSYKHMHMIKVMLCL